MRCCCCQRNLSDFESTQRHAITLEFLDMCNKCLSGLGIPAIGNAALSDMAPSDFDDEAFDFGDEDD